MTLNDLAIGAAWAIVLLLCLRLFVGCTVASVSVDCPVANDATGEAGAQP